MNRYSKLLGDQLGFLLHLQSPAQRVCRIPQQCPVTGSRDQRNLIIEMVRREPDQAIRQLGKTPSILGGDRKRLAGPATWSPRDLPNRRACCESSKFDPGRSEPLVPFSHLQLDTRLLGLAIDKPEDQISIGCPCLRTSYSLLLDRI